MATLYVLDEFVAGRPIWRLAVAGAALLVVQTWVRRIEQRWRRRLPARQGA